MFFDTFSRLCNEKHKSPNAVAKELGIPSGSITNWKNGTNPRHGTLLKIADYFDVSVDYLLGKAPEQSNDLSEDERELLGLLRQLSDDDLTTALKLVKLMAEKHKQ